MPSSTRIVRHAPWLLAVLLTTCMPSSAAAPTPVPVPSPSTTPTARGSSSPALTSTPPPTSDPRATTPAIPPPSATVRPSPTVRPTPRPDPASALVALPKLSVKIRYADSIRYYSIRGRNPDQIVESIRANGPPGDHPAFPGHQDIMATTTPDYAGLVFLQRIGDDACRISAVTGKATYRVQLPRMIGPSKLPAALLTWWKAMLEHTRWHEEQHILISQRWISTLKKRIVGKPCGDANRIIARWTNDLSAAQLAFDRKDTSWAAPVYRGPWTW